MYIVGSAAAHRTVYQGGAYKESLIDNWMETNALFTHNYTLTNVIPDVMRNEANAGGPDSYWDPLTMDGKLHLVRHPTIHFSGWYVYVWR